MTIEERTEFRDQLEHMIETMPGSDFAVGMMVLGAVGAYKAGVSISKIEEHVREALALAALKVSDKADA